jgi:hypothetical protein
MIPVLTLRIQIIQNYPTFLPSIAHTCFLDDTGEHLKPSVKRYQNNLCLLGAYLDETQLR